MKFITLILTLLTTTAYARFDCNILTSKNICVQLQWNGKPTSNKTLSNTVRFIDLEQSSDEEIMLVAPEKKVVFKTWKIGVVEEHGSQEIKTVNTEVGVYRNYNIVFPDNKKSGIWQFQMEYDGLIFVLDELK